MNDGRGTSARPIGRCRIRWTKTRSLQCPEERRQVGGLAGRQASAARVAVLEEDVLERLGAAVVQERLAAADPPQGRGIELALACLVGQADVVSPRRRG